MIPYGDKMDVYGWGGGAVVGCPLLKKMDSRRRGWDGFNK